VRRGSKRKARSPPLSTVPEEDTKHKARRGMKGGRGVECVGAVDAAMPGCCLVGVCTSRLWTHVPTYHTSHVLWIRPRGALCDGAAVSGLLSGMLKRFVKKKATSGRTHVEVADKCREGNAEKALPIAPFSRECGV